MFLLSIITRGLRGIQNVGETHGVYQGWRFVCVSGGVGRGY